MREDSWLSTQMINLMATFITQFVQMISYCAQDCILECRQCFLRKFSFSLDEKFIFYFPSAQNEFFCEGPTIYLLQNWIKSFFLKYQAIFDSQLTKWLGVKSFDRPLVKKTNSRRFSRKRVEFELQLPHSFLFIFSKNNFLVHKYLFNQRNMNFFPRFYHQLGTVMPVVLTHFQTGIENSKKSNN